MYIYIHANMYIYIYIYMRGELTCGSDNSYVPTVSLASDDACSSIQANSMASDVMLKLDYVWAQGSVAWI